MGGRDIYLAPRMRAVPALVIEAEGAISTFDPGFTGVMVGADHVPGQGGVLVIGVHERDGRFVCGVVVRRDLAQLRAMIDDTIAAIDAGAYAQPAVQQ
jgi:hypothetical protein